jgi:hypothetical protein
MIDQPGFAEIESNAVAVEHILETIPPKFSNKGTAYEPTMARDEDFV